MEITVRPAERVRHSGVSKYNPGQNFTLNACRADSAADMLG